MTIDTKTETQPGSPSFEGGAAYEAYCDSIEAAVERLARQIAAWKMGLVKDRRGERLPDDLWRQCIPAAKAELGLDNEKAASEETAFPTSA